VTRPTAAAVADRALVLYALVRRATIELALEEYAHDPHRVAQAEAARRETVRWLAREGLFDAPTAAERTLFDAPSGAWPRGAVSDGMWRKEALGALLWALEHVESLPGPGTEFDPRDLDQAITRYGSVGAFRSNGRLRDDETVVQAWHEADAWLAATEGRAGEDAAIASVSAERARAFRWVLESDAASP
jgi:hypothetical protein